MIRRLFYKRSLMDDLAIVRGVGSGGGMEVKKSRSWQK
jgi:hypothetical protein